MVNTLLCLKGLIKISWTNIKVSPKWKGWEIERQQKRLDNWIKEEKNGESQDNQN